MFAKKKSTTPKGNLVQYGLFDIPTDLNFDNMMNLDGNNDMGGEDDSDLEAELKALTEGIDTRKKDAKGKTTGNLDNMIAESLRDISSDEDISVDENDPNLLSELNEFAGADITEKPLESQPPPQPIVTLPQMVQKPLNPSENNQLQLLEERLKMYESAEVNARNANESSRARRFQRGIKTLKDQIKQVKIGKMIPNDEIPLEVSVEARNKKTDENASNEAQIISIKDETTKPVGNDENDVDLAELTKRKDQFKAAALRAKRAGDKTTALHCIKIVKQFDLVCQAVERGETVDLSNMPSPPALVTVSSVAPEPQREILELQKSSVNQMPQDTQATNITVAQEAEPSKLITANSIEEALTQRLEVYQKQAEAARVDGNESKVRRMGRIIKQYEQALKLCRSGKSIPLEELPTPPGFAPIPTEQKNPVPVAPPRRPSNKAVVTNDDDPSTKSLPQTTRISGNHGSNSRAEKQLQQLLARQKEFKLAALNAKKKGELEEAKSLLRSAKGFDRLIEAASGGMPVDLTSIPVSPTAKSQLSNAEPEIVAVAEECIEGDNESLDVLARLETQLSKQLRLCLNTRDHHKALGDVAGVNRFERLALSVTKDLDVVRVARRQLVTTNTTPTEMMPKFHYENRDFSIVRCNVDLNENDLEITVVRGICYTCQNPKQIDTYVKFESPFTQDGSNSNRTAIIYDTNSPEYNQIFTLNSVQRTSRVCQRVFKRGAIKFEVYSKGGFLRGDSLIGVITVKLQPLENQCELHESFDLMDGRKRVGGKLEVHLRVRKPIVTQQVEQLHEKWLVIDN